MLISKNNKTGSRGAVLTELSLAIPLLFFLLFGLIDLSVWLNQHFHLSSIAYEGVRYASSMTGLSDDSDTTQGRFGAIQMRITNLVHQYFPDVENPSVNVLYSGLENGNTVSVDIEIPYESKFLFWQTGLTVHVFAQAPYLYPANDGARGS